MIWRDYLLLDQELSEIIIILYLLPPINSAVVIVCVLGGILIKYLSQIYFLLHFFRHSSQLRMFHEERH